MKHLLIEDHMPTSNDFSILVILEMITKLYATITNKKTFLKFWIKFTSSNNINMNIQNTTKHF